MCDPRKNALMKEGNKSDKIDACKLADLLRGGYLRSVYHGENGLRTLKELARSYLTISKDLTRVMNRVKALYRSWGILSVGQQVYAPRHRTEWLNKIGEAGVRRRAEFFYQQLDALRELRQEVRKDLLAESRATQEQLRDTLGACQELNPVYRRLLKLALEELQLIEKQISQLDQEIADLLRRTRTRFSGWRRCPVWEWIRRSRSLPR